MIRNLVLPIAAATLLAGCMTSGYQYRGGQGDYYYGQPSSQYNDYGYGPYGSLGYGHPSGWRGGYGYGYGAYGHPFWYGGYGYPYGYGGYGYPYGYGGGYPYMPYRPPVIRPGDSSTGGSQPPWRGIGNLRPPAPIAGPQPPPPTLRSLLTPATSRQDQPRPVRAERPTIPRVSRDRDAVRRTTP